LTDRWSHVSALFDEAMELDREAREALLLRRAAGDAATVAEVRQLLAAHDRAGGFLETPAWAERPDLLAEDLDRAPDLTGRQLGPYRVIEKLGHGGMGVVYAAHDTRLGRTVALKALPPAFTRDRVARQRLAREARAAAGLSHPAIATVYAFEEIEGEVFIASELVRGRTLRMVLASGPLVADDLVRTLTSIAEALEAAHQQSIIHRDLKPENVLISNDGRVKVVDFGLARSLTPPPGSNQSLTVTGALLGTPGYMAPEQLRGATLDARADVFAFGVMAYECATGAHPFGGFDAAAVVERLVSRQPALAQTINPPALDAIVRRSLEVDPAARFASGHELLLALRRLGEHPSIATPRVLSARAWWWWQFHQLAIGLLTSAATIAVWISRPWLASWGSPLFLITLVLATISVTLRLHLWFASHVHPMTLPTQRARLLRWIAGLEGALFITLLSIGIAISGRHDAIAAWLIVTAVLHLLSLGIIEPATSAAALAEK
jgi:eukaryotic-like serine/threonine-protein kinase